MTPEELLLNTLIAYIPLMVLSTIFIKGKYEKVARSSITVIAFGIIGLIICSVDIHDNFWMLGLTRGLGGVFLCVAAAHVGMIIHIVRNR